MGQAHPELVERVQQTVCDGLPRWVMIGGKLHRITL
jgi:hypothetical protein